MSRNSGYNGLNGPNQEVSAIVDYAKAQQRAVKEERAYNEAQEERRAKLEYEKFEKLLDVFKENHNSSNRVSSLFSPINIVNANTVEQKATSITNITLTDEQFKELISVLKSQ